MIAFQGMRAGPLPRLHNVCAKPHRSRSESVDDIISTLRSACDIARIILAPISRVNP